jgi:hypothetical protein
MTVTMADVCDCGRSLQLHYRDPEKYRQVQALVGSLGVSVEVTVEGVGSWMVPRHYIALHGIKAADLPALAARYGWARA